MTDYVLRISDWSSSVCSSDRLSISGGSILTIEYILSDTLLKNMKPPEYEVKPLDLDGWYVVVYRDVPWHEAALWNHPVQRPVSRSVGRAAASPLPPGGLSSLLSASLPFCLRPTFPPCPRALRLGSGRGAGRRLPPRPPTRGPPRPG